MNMKKKIIFDVCLILTVLAVSVLSLLIFNAQKTVGDSVQVSVNGELCGEFPLGENATYSLNGGTNVLVIENGQAYMTYANCPDGVCVRRGKISYVGQRIICLPNKIVVAVIGSGDGILEV